MSTRRAPERAAHADLLAALGDPQAGHADDAAGGDQQQQHADRDQHPRQRAVGAVAVACGPRRWSSASMITGRRRRPCAAPLRLPSSRGRAGPARRAPCTSCRSRCRQAHRQDGRDTRRARRPARCCVCRRSTTPTTRAPLASSPVPKYRSCRRALARPGHSLSASALVMMTDFGKLSLVGVWRRSP